MVKNFNEKMKELKENVLEFIKTKFDEEEVRYYVKNNIVYYTKEKMKYEFDVSNAILENYGIADINEIILDVEIIIDNNYFGVPSLDRITPYLVTQDEYERKYASIPVGNDMKNGLVTIYFDNMIGLEGTFVNELRTHNIQELHNLAVKNIEKFYVNTEFDFEVTNVEGLFKFESEVHSDDARALLYVEEITSYLEEFIGSDYYFVFTNNGSLYVSHVDIDIHDLISKHDCYCTNVIESTYHIFKKHEGVNFKLGEIKNK